MSDEKTHPSYGMIRFNRIMGGGKRRLFGSVLRDHGTTIILDIMPGSRRYDLGHDWYHGTLKPLISVELSSAQFVELLTSMNVGSGVPCTIRYLNNEPIEDPPDDETEMDRIENGFRDDVHELTEQMEEDRGRVEKIVTKKGGITKRDREEISKIVARLFREVEQNLPFIQESFTEATEKTVAHAKAEVDSTITAAVARLGLQSLQQLNEAAVGQTMKQLEGVDDKED